MIQYLKDFLLPTSAEITVFTGVKYDFLSSELSSQISEGSFLYIPNLKGSFLLMIALYRK